MKIIIILHIKEWKQTIERCFLKLIIESIMISLFLKSTEIYFEGHFI